MSAYVIDVKIADSKATNSALGRLERALDRLDSLMSKLSDGLNGAASNINSAANGLGRAANAASKARSASSNLPYTDPQQVQDRLRDRVMQGDPEAADVFLRMQNRINRTKRAQKLALGQGDSLADIFARTRFASVGGIPIPMPLGRDLKALGGMAGIDIGKVLGPKFAGAGGAAMATAGIAAAGAAAYMLSRGLQEAYTRLRAYTAGFTAIGGFTGQAGGAMTVSRALGLSPDYAAALGARIGSDSVARMVAARAGVNGTRGYFGDINDAEAMRDIVRYLGRLSYDQARREAIGLGDAKLAEIALFSPGLRNRMLNSGGLDMNQMRRGAEFSGEFALFNQQLEKFMAILSGPAFVAGAEGLAHLSSALDKLGRISSALPSPVEQISRLSESLERVGLSTKAIFGSPLDKIADLFDAIGKLFGPKNQGKSPELKTLEEIRKGIDSLNDGVYGGGERSRRAQQGPRGGPNGDALDRSVAARELRSGLGI
jgi:hypothetical protein